ncbi:uncharacterized protein LOC126898453 isoform X2 [Daktulosphaira vitifoliae]|uniref:uncharacterized protein LOC126898453 isoform X2 n=1 Tax=Daktulosphaira vitifoliae TaxID=58002 RepID=UPI0021AA9A3C|nr:uncharacterized protein LOC126898453 isoform X2 [Daktulosphaira vitifoliae]
MTKKSKVIFDLESELNKLHCDIQRKSRQCDIETKNLETIRKKQDEGNLKTPQVQIVQVKKELEDINNKIDFLKKSWIEKQNNNIKKTEQRNVLINKINKLKKYNSVADAKNVELKQDIQSLSKKIDHYKINFTHMRNDILKYSQNISNTKGKTNFLSTESEWLQNKYDAELKESEEQCIEYADQLKAIKTELDEIQNKYIEKQREIITWDNKIKQIIEIKKEIVNKKGDTRHIDAMKIKIHRMQIRENQLKKTLEKFYIDLEGCISKSVTIYNKVASKKSKIKEKSEPKQRINKKMDDLRLNIYKSKINIQHLSYEQSYAKYLELVKQGKYRLLIKNELIINEKYTAARKKNHDILCVVEALKNDNPNLDNEFLRIINILSIEIN